MILSNPTPLVPETLSIRRVHGHPNVRIFQTMYNDLVFFAIISIINMSAAETVIKEQ